MGVRLRHPPLCSAGDGRWPWQSVIRRRALVVAAAFEDMHRSEWPTEDRHLCSLSLSPSKVVAAAAAAARLPLTSGTAVSWRLAAPPLSPPPSPPTSSLPLRSVAYIPWIIFFSFSSYRSRRAAGGRALAVGAREYSALHKICWRFGACKKKEEVIRFRTHFLNHRT